MRMQRLILIAMVVACLGAPGVLCAQLSFKSEVVKRNADAAEERLEVVFPFRNSTSHVVQIQKIETSCGCLKAESDKMVIPPGESGVVTGLFSIGGKTGVSNKSLKVITVADRRERSQQLRLTVTVPDVMVVEPKLNSWDVGEKLAPKSYVLEVKRDEEIRVVSAECSREGFECKVHTIEEGKKYRIEVTPGSTEDTLMGILRIETDCSIDKHRRQLAFFSVKKSS